VPTALPGVLAAIAVVLGASGAYSQTQLNQYAVKFVCGKAAPTPAGPPPVAVGYYSTDINVHSPNSGTIQFRKKFAVALPNQKAGQISQFFPATLQPDEAFSVECAEITKKLNLAAGSFVTGFAVFEIQGPRELDIVAVYTAAATLNGTIVTMHTERVPKRP
jgi:hypothetical protein